jgi:hypothetical protein
VNAVALRGAKRLTKRGPELPQIRGFPGFNYTGKGLSPGCHRPNSSLGGCWEHANGPTCPACRGAPLLRCALPATLRTGAERWFCCCRDLRGLLDSSGCRELPGCRDWPDYWACRGYSPGLTASRCFPGSKALPGPKDCRVSRAMSHRDYPESCHQAPPPRRAHLHRRRCCRRQPHQRHHRPLEPTPCHLPRPSKSRVSKPFAA